MLLMSVAMMSAQLLPATLEPSEPWTLSSQDDGCTVARALSGDNAIQIGFQTTMQSRPAHFLVRGSRKLLPDGVGELPLSFDAGEPVMVHYGSFETSEKGVRLTKLFPDQSTMTRLAAATKITVGNRMPPLQVTGMSEAIQVVDRCTAEKLVSWGVDPTTYFNRQTAGFTGNFAAMFDARSYPKEARATGASGRLVVLLKTDRQGSVVDCRILTSPDPSLNAGTCEVAKRGRLKPPLDPAGQPIASFAVLPVRWERP